MDDIRRVTMQNAAGATGNGNALDVTGLASLGLQVSGTFVGTVAFEGTVDDANWVALQVAAVNTGAVSTTTTAAGLFGCSVAGLSQVRARVSAWASGSVTVIGHAIRQGAGATLADIDIQATETIAIDQTTPGTTNKVIADPNTATPTAYNVTLTNANTEYSQALPANCRGFEFQAQGDVAIRFAFVTGKVATPTAPYLDLKAGDYYFSYPINQGASPSTLYFASGTAATVVEILAWV